MASKSITANKLLYAQNHEILELEEPNYYLDGTLPYKAQL